MKWNNKWCKIAFWIAQWTWGAVMSVIGLVFLGFQAATKNIEKAELVEGTGVVLIKLKNNITWGVSLGMFIFEGQGYDATIVHEVGHSVQNLVWGPLFLFVIGLPSLIRAGIFGTSWAERQVAANKLKWLHLDSYYSIWFEKQATVWGSRYATALWERIKEF